MRKLTNEEYIQKAKEVHGVKYDYSKTLYISSREPITIICPIHLNCFVETPSFTMGGNKI